MTSQKRHSRFDTFLIPEIIDQIALFSNPPDLRKATLVSHRWNLLFTPHLWRTIDGSLYAWPKIIGIKGSKNMDILHTKDSPILVDAAAATLLQLNGNNNNSNWNIKSFFLWDMKTSSAGLKERALEKATVLAQVTDLLRSFLPNLDLEPNHQLFKTLGGLSNITYFNCGQEFRFRLSQVPDYWPRLTTLKASKSAHNEDLHMTRPIPRLRSLVLHYPITLQIALHVLDSLPDLEFFEISHILDPKEEDDIYWTLFSALPFLTTLKVDDLGHDTSKAIATHCPQLEVLIDYKKPKITYAADILNELSALEPILQSCPNL
ncbi:hypothetical protein K457DRAFT_13100 [Linnemannia elongata AG-77]|uniref:F-box domain-containing protein n=1 Tax=Linnemannia elongata AG-77 TaxID=1314771 RepID=A0A197KED0_9FUNG|nr:hypothetical protein K457DRAFT_13100 [Linnemannia elongata AG-77]